VSPLCLHGQLDRDVACLLLEQLASCGPEDAPFTVDLSDTSIRDITVLEVLIEPLCEAARRLGTIELVGAPPPLRIALGARGASAPLVLRT